MNWLDWLIVAVLVFSAFQGFRRGLVSSVAKLAGLLVGFGVGITYNRDLAAYLNKQWGVEDKIMPVAEKILRFFFPVKEAAGPVYNAGGAVSSGGLAAAQPSPFSMLYPYSESLVSSFTATILNAICFLVLILATVWIVNFAGYLLTRIAKASPLGPVNHIGGLIFGAAKGMIIMMILLALMSPFQRSELLPENSSGATPGQGGAFAESKLLPYFSPLFKAIDRPLPGVAPLKKEPVNPVQSI